MKHTQTQGDGETGPASAEPTAGRLASLPHYTNLEFNSLPGWARDLILALEQRAAAPALAASHAEMLAVLSDIASRMAKHGSGDVMLHSRIMAAVKDAKKVAGGAA